MTPMSFGWSIAGSVVLLLVIATILGMIYRICRRACTWWGLRR